MALLLLLLGHIRILRWRWWRWRSMVSAVDDAAAHLLGEGELHGAAVGGAQLGDALLHGLHGVLDLGHHDALVGLDVLAGDDGQVNGLLDAGLDGLGVGHGDGGLVHSDHRGVVASLLGDLLAVVVAVAVVAVAWTVLTNGHHLNIASLLKSNIHRLSSGLFCLLFVGVGADLVLDNLDALGADGGGDGVAELAVHDLLDGQLHVSAHGLEGGGAGLHGLNNIDDAAVVLGGLVGVVGGGVVGGGVVHSVVGNDGGVVDGVVGNDGGGVVHSVVGGGVHGVGDHGGVVHGVGDGGGVVGGVVGGAVAHSSEVGESGEGNISVGVRGRGHQGDENQGECLKTTTPMLLNAPNDNCITVP